MFKHLFKLLWNKRKKNFLFLSEILVSFLVTFAVFSLLTFYYQNYTKPLGLDYKNVWAVTYDNQTTTTDTDSLDIFYKNLALSLTAMPQIESISYSGSNIPYSNNTSTTVMTQGNRKFDQVSTYTVGNDYHKVWNMEMLDGRWFLPEDAVTKNKGIVINETLKNEVFGKDRAVGKLIGNHDNLQFKVVGVVKDSKAGGDFWPAGSATFKQLDTAYLKNTRTLLVKVRDNADAKFEGELYKFMANTIKNSVEIKHLDEMRESKNNTTIIPMVIFMIIAGFLIINVALGIFGVLWYNINQRKGEIGLRRAIGASGSSVSLQLVSESLILATMSLAVGCFFAAQFPILNVFDVPASIYLIAILLSVLFIYLLVFACSFYPGKQAAHIRPAIALHEE